MARFIRDIVRRMAPASEPAGIGPTWQPAGGPGQMHHWHWSAQGMSGPTGSGAVGASAKAARNNGEGAMNCIIVGSENDGFLDHFELLSRWLSDIACVNDLAEATAVRFGRSGTQPRMVLVDIDVMQSSREVVEDLILFRRSEPETPVVIGSRAFRAHDFSRERAVIADASLCLPSGSTDLSTALTVAIRNNRGMAA